MAECIVCGKNLNFWQGDHNRRCDECVNARLWPEGHPNHNADIASRKEQSDAEMMSIDAVLLTTETAPSLNIIKRIEIVTAECAFGMNVFKDMFIAISNVVGGRSETVQKAMRESRKTALFELKREAYLVGANAVVGVDLDYVEMGSAGSSMVMLVASGTAVTIEPI